MEAEAQYLAGFLDGDGNISLLSRSRRWLRPAPCVSAAQSYNRREPPELRFLQSKFDGGIYRDREATETARCSWRFQAYASSMEKMLSVMADHGIVKRPQAELALDYLAGEKIDAEYFAYEISREKSIVESVEIDVDRLTIPYLAGLFVAEGSVGLHLNQCRSYNLASSIRQSSCPRLLHAIKNKLGYGYVSSGQLKFSGKATAKFLESVQPFIKKSQKRRQINVAQKYVQYAATVGVRPGVPRSGKEKTRIERFAKKLRKLKKG